MDMIKIEKAKSDAQRFIDSVDRLKIRISNENVDGAHKCGLFHGHYNEGPHIRGCKESGAIRRASMDLSRALANLRK